MRQEIGLMLRVDSYSEDIMRKLYHRGHVKYKISLLDEA